MPAFEHHVLVNIRQRDGTAWNRLLVGSSDDIGKEVGHMVTTAVGNGHGPITLNPIHPAEVYRIGARP